MKITVSTQGPVVLQNVSVVGNTIEGAGRTPVHCGPGCGLRTCLYDEQDRPVRAWTPAGCAACPDCFASADGDTAWTTDILLRDNRITP